MSNTNDLMLDVSQAVELKLAFRRNGWTNAEIKTLSEGNILGEVLKVIKKQAEIKCLEHLIDCDANPFIPQGWSVEKHQLGGLFKFNSNNIFPFQSKKQIKGDKLRQELKDKSVLNANVLDYLLAHPELIPEKWKGKYIFFFGTIYRNSFGNLYVRYLDFNGSRWDWDYYWLGRDFDSGRFSAVAS